ncbi:beta-glucosidase BglX [Alkaliflexus imshenetskii]|uniref:beta-glucosidase BglX n=1 Tax=Alkaliflexus imshenetskii TaxID=286730 RepID=UPI00047AED4B|nr:beta-glucosidase BglX [Alkaliflexus imshenetskii]
MRIFKLVAIVVFTTLMMPGCNGPEKVSCKIEQNVEQLLSRMTLREKIGQMNQLNGRRPDEAFFEQIKNGEIGSILNIEQPELINHIQSLAVNESRLGIPLLIARDVIHGYKTIFPIPLGQAASFNPDIVQEGARIAAAEATQDGIRWTFAPMMDISRDPRWGRIAESFGEDTYLTEVLAVAMIRGFQGDDLSNPSSMAACAKHLIGYGAAEGGKDYNSTYIPERQLRNVYLPPFEAAVKAGCATIMTSFNDNDGIPATGNRFLLRDILRKEWRFDGVVVSDWASVKEMVVHGFSADDKDAAMTAINAGLDMEMVSLCYIRHLETLVEEGKVSISTIDEAVRNILRLKFRLGLFDNPYIETDKTRLAYSEEHLQAAKIAAEESFVLLKNNNNVLPLNDRVKTIAVIGPMADAPHDQMGTWVFDGEKEHTVTPLTALREMYGNQVNIIYEEALKFSRDKDKSRFNKALDLARRADVVIVFVGEESILSGEAHSLADISLQGAQTDLIREIKKAKKPLVTVFMAGRPLTIGEEVDLSDAVLYAWHPGTMGGPAIADMLFGKSVPSGKLPVTFPKMVGQIPVYYNHNRTGRPARGNEVLLDEIPLEARQSSLGNTSYYLDAGFGPLFHFGFGLSYTTFDYENLILSSLELDANAVLEVSFNLTNSGAFEATEVVQLYVTDLVGSTVRPVKELKEFRRVSLKPGETRKISFHLPIASLAFYGIDMEYKVEPGMFNLMVGGNSQEGLMTQFSVCL